MSLSAIGFNPATPAIAESQKPAVAPASTQSEPATLKPDTVTLSSAGRNDLAAGDPDHDGH